MTRVETLLYLLQNNKVLLIYKKRGLGQGFYNGVGGKVEANETPEECAVRECKEEIDVIPSDLEWMGLLEFYNDGKLYGYVHVFISRKFAGTPKETEEAEPIWFDIHKIPYENMWSDDIFWLPHILNNEKVLGRFWFEKWSKIIKKEVYILQSPELKSFYH
ncbi:MAG: 8-oxo-dGTP diphosphatase [Candidatus Njordarchaeales archaeon]